MAFAFPARMRASPSPPLRGNDPLLDRVFHVAGLVTDIAAGEDLACHLNDFDQAALPHIPSWRGPDKAFNQQDAIKARLASDLLAAEITLFRRQTLRHRLEVTLVNDLQFALAVTADSYLTRTDWPGQHLWRAAPLEARLFDTALGLAELERRLAPLQPETRLDDRRLHRACRFLLAVLADRTDDPAAQAGIGGAENPVMVLTDTAPTGTPGRGLVPAAGGTVSRSPSLMSCVLISAVSAVAVGAVAIGGSWAGIRLWSAARLAALWGG